MKNVMKEMQSTRVVFRRMAIAAVAVWLAVSLLGLAMADVSVTIKSGSKVYASASSSSDSVEVSHNTDVKLTGLSKGLARVKHNGKTGYVRASALKLSHSFRVYTSEKCGMYKSASSGSGKVTSLSKGTALMIGSISGDYAYAADQSGNKGYVKLSVLTSKSSGKSSSGSSSSGGSKVDNLISVAKSLMGVSYDKMNCSEYTEYCYRKIGIDIAGSAKSQGYSRKFTRINSVSGLKRGDLVVFDTEDDGDLADHVGIYLGSGRFIHSSSAKGKVVESRLSAGYYRSAFSWGLRIIG